MTRQELSDLQRRVNNVASYGTIVAVDHGRGLVRVDVAGRLTDWLPTPGVVGQNYRGSTPMRVGTQVLVTAPSGDPANGVLSTVLYSTALPPVDTSGNVDVIEWNDGTKLAYDSASQTLSVEAAKDLTVTCVGNLTIKARRVSIQAETDLVLVGGGDIRMDAAGVRVFEGG